MVMKMPVKGNEAIGEAAIRAGCRYFFGYPITPQNEIPEYMARMLPKVGGVFLQAESEVAAINMVYGAASTGVRVMTSSSSPGISLKQEGISFLAGAQLPCLIVNIMRSGPGLGGVLPSQSDYFQATRGGGHGDYRTPVYAPSSVQEMADLVRIAFETADTYRTPVMILADGALGQMMEPVEFEAALTEQDYDKRYDKSWAVGQATDDPQRIVTSLNLDALSMEQHNLMLQANYDTIKEKETRAEHYFTTDAELVLVAYGMTARICKGVVDELRDSGIRAGLLRPITLWPFPDQELNDAVKTAESVLTVEMSLGQMVEDVRLAVGCKVPVDFYGRTGGVVPTVHEILQHILEKRGGSR
jgi:2-oxoglutarate ferredoxin oxidoreductase subunit alpha